jgi:hypothetical protein
MQCTAGPRSSKGQRVHPPNACAPTAHKAQPLHLLTLPNRLARPRAPPARAAATGASGPFQLRPPPPRAQNHDLPTPWLHRPSLHGRPPGPPPARPRAPPLFEGGGIHQALARGRSLSRCALQQATTRLVKHCTAPHNSVHAGGAMRMAPPRAAMTETPSHVSFESQPALALSPGAKHCNPAASSCLAPSLPPTSRVMLLCPPPGVYTRQPQGARRACGSSVAAPLLGGGRRARQAEGRQA